MAGPENHTSDWNASRTERALPKQSRCLLGHGTFYSQTLIQIVASSRLFAGTEQNYDNSPGQAQRRPGLRTQNDLLLFPFWLAPNAFGASQKGKRRLCGVAFYPGRRPPASAPLRRAGGGLALGYYQAAPPGLLPSPRYGKASRKGEPDASANAGRASRGVSGGAIGPAWLRFTLDAEILQLTQILA